MKIYNLLSLIAIIVTMASCKKDVKPPMITSVTPTQASAMTLVTFEGENLTNITELSFSGQIVNFNNAYNSDNALLFRIPTNIPLGEHEVKMITAGGEATTMFRITLEAPQIFNVHPEFASPGDVVEITGTNFYDPVEVYFHNNVQAQIKTLFQDSMEVIVPEGIEKGRITVVANGGDTISPQDFFSVREILINDFDGNGMRNDNSKWAFIGNIDQDASNAFQDFDPAPLDGNFMKVSGFATSSTVTWVGGPQSYVGTQGDPFEGFGITTIPNNTLLEMDIHSNGQPATNIILILKEYQGSNFDFTEEVEVDWDGWKRVSIPLNRFDDLDGFTVDPAKVNLLKIHLIDETESGEKMEVNVDNIRFVEIL